MIEAFNDVMNQELKLFDLEQALGRYPDVHRGSKFGRNLGITATSIFQDVWSSPTQFNRTDLTIASTLYIVSDSASDTAVQFNIRGLDANYKLQQTTVTLTGTTPLQLQGTWLRVNFAEVVGNVAKVGAVTISTENSLTPTTASIQAYCAAECQKALFTHLCIPAGYYGVMKSFTASASKGKDLQVRAVAKQFGGIYKAEEEIGIYETTNQLQTHFFTLPPKTDIKFQAITSNPTAQCFISYTVFLIPEKYKVANLIPYTNV